MDERFSYKDYTKYLKGGGRGAVCPFACSHGSRSAANAYKHPSR